MFSRRTALVNNTTAEFRRQGAGQGLPQGHIIQQYGRQAGTGQYQAATLVREMAGKDEGVGQGLTAGA